MVGIGRIEELVSRERKIFNFLVFYMVLAVFLVVLFLNSNGWTFIETAVVVLLAEILITGFVKRGKPLHTNEEVSRELGKMEQVNEYRELREEYLENKGNTIAIALTVYSLGAIFLTFVTKFNYSYMALSFAGFLVLYFSIYLFFRYKISRLTIILLERSRVVREMRMEKRKERKKKKLKKLVRLGKKKKPKSKKARKK